MKRFYDRKISCLQVRAFVGAYCLQVRVLYDRKIYCLQVRAYIFRGPYILHAAAVKGLKALVSGRSLFRLLLSGTTFLLTSDTAVLSHSLNILLRPSSLLHSAYSELL